MVDKQQGFPVDSSVSNVHCAYRHNVFVLAKLHVYNHVIHIKLT